MAEQRVQARAEVEIDVHYRSAQEFLAAYSKNISGGGIYLHTQEPHPLNTNILLRFTLPGISHRFQIPGLVVWSSPQGGRGVFPAGVGVKFLELSPADSALLTDFVTKAAGDGGHTAHAPEPARDTQPVPPPARTPPTAEAASAPRGVPAPKPTLPTAAPVRPAPASASAAQRPRPTAPPAGKPAPAARSIPSTAPAQKKS
ncbi:MAG: TIGR02266 family protein [Candidatus Methylomirabilota bacterium]